MKYGVWGTTKEENQKIQELYDESKENKLDLILLVGSTRNNYIFGAARVIAPVNFEVKFPLWWDKQHDEGFCHLEWLFVKLVNLGSHPQLSE